MNEEQWKSVFGEGIHTAFRKGTDHPKSHEYWVLIRDMPDELWDDVLSYLVWSLGLMKLITVNKEVMNDEKERQQVDSAD